MSAHGTGPTAQTVQQELLLASYGAALSICVLRSRLVGREPCSSILIPCAAGGSSSLCHQGWGVLVLPSHQRAWDRDEEQGAEPSQCQGHRLSLSSGFHAGTLVRGG